VTSQNLATRLKALREGKGLTKYRLAKLSGISEVYIYRLELGQIKNPRRDTLQKLTHGLGITLAELIGDPAPVDTWHLVEQSLKAYIPVYGEVSASMEGIEPVDYVACTRVRVAPETLRAYRVSGLCLDPEIRSGDTVVVDLALSPASGDLVVVIFEDGGCAVKRYREGDNGRWLEDNDGRYQPDGAKIHGVVMEFVRKVR
jgi:transcriptional regulator with XRE-family HTH domain